MVLILSDNNDISTCRVIKWLNYNKTEWIRINETDAINLTEIVYQDSELVRFRISCNNLEIDLTKVTAYWYRRGWLNGKETDQPFSLELPELNRGILQHLNEEAAELFTFIHRYLAESKRNINSFLTAVNRKMSYQFYASKVGLQVPDSLVTSSKEALWDFYNRNNGSIITKSINESLGFNVNKEQYYSKTYQIRKVDIDNGPSVFFLTLFQEQIEKFIELRIFFMDDRFYSMAIFSQQNEQTKLDFRNYDWSNPNRNVPFQLPHLIEDQLRNFMKSIDLNCGSIDMILTNEYEYVFLEVNPVGQFGMVSFPCNYQLEMKIAEYFKSA